MKKKLIAIGMAATLAVSSLLMVATSAQESAAAPITCPSGQVATKTSSGWKCVNKGGNPSSSAHTKNPNDKK